MKTPGRQPKTLNPFLGFEWHGAGPKVRVLVTRCTYCIYGLGLGAGTTAWKDPQVRKKFGEVRLSELLVKTSGSSVTLSDPSFELEVGGNVWTPCISPPSVLCMAEICTGASRFVGSQRICPIVSSATPTKSAIQFVWC